MKYIPLIFIIGLLSLSSCSNEAGLDTIVLDDQEISFRKNSTSICHLKGNGEFQRIKVNPKAVPAHLAHGDYLTGDDGYCYTCTHCDVNQITQYDWEAYFDADGLTCTIYTGATIWTNLSTPDGNARGVSAIEFPSTGQKFVLSWLPGGSYCQREVGVDISEEEWENCLTFIRNVINTRPDTPELCDILSARAQEAPEMKALPNSIFQIRAIPFNSLQND